MSSEPSIKVMASAGSTGVSLKLRMSSAMVSVMEPTPSETWKENSACPEAFGAARNCRPCSCSSVSSSPAVIAVSPSAKKTVPMAASGRPSTL